LALAYHYVTVIAHKGGHYKSYCTEAFLLTKFADFAQNEQKKNKTNPQQNAPKCI
jgi:hypothetical protein